MALLCEPGCREYDLGFRGGDKRDQGKEELLPNPYCVSVCGGLGGPQICSSRWARPQAVL